MKLKQHADDFFVEELTDVSLGVQGQFAYYRLDKTGWTTPDAIAAIRERWHIDARRIAFGGLKDRYAHTIQYLTIHYGPRRTLSQAGLTLKYLGQTDSPYSSRCIRANRFRITLRDLAAAHANTAVNAAGVVREHGVPNYFDDQRFGSVAGGQEFAAKLMVQGRFEEALKLALTAPYEFDRTADKRTKATLLHIWGQWPECRRRLPRGHVSRLVSYLARFPDDFRGAVTLLQPELQGLYLSAYQSHLWNRILAARLVQIVATDDLRPIPLRLGELPVPVKLDDERRAHLLTETIPLPAARWPFDATAPWAESAKRVLADEGLTWEDLKIKGLRKPFFARGERAVLCVPAAMTAESGPDDNHPGRSLVRLGFDLPRGAYATIVVKRVLM